MALPALQHADRHLLNRYLVTGENIHTLLAQPDAPSLLDLLAFLARPDIATWLDHFRDLQSHSYRHAAFRTLTTLLTPDASPTERFRIAATILRHTHPPRPMRTGHAHHQRSDSADAEPPSRAPRTSASIAPPRTPATRPCTAGPHAAAPEHTRAPIAQAPAGSPDHREPTTDTNAAPPSDSAPIAAIVTPPAGATAATPATHPAPTLAQFIDALADAHLSTEAAALFHDALAAADPETELESAAAPGPAG